MQNKYDDTEEMIINQDSIEYEEKTADEMFTTRGFYKVSKVGIEEYIDKDDNYIQFDLTIERFTCNCYLSIKELQAINKKCKELGWLDE